LSDLEATGYAGGAVDLCAAGVGAPHIRQRLWWVGERLGNANNPRREGDVLHPLWGGRDRSGPDGGASGSSKIGDMGNPDNAGPQGQRQLGNVDAPSEWSTAGRYSATASMDGGLADSTSVRRVEGVTHDGRLRGGDSAEGSAGRSTVNGDLGSGLADTDDADGRGQFGLHAQDRGFVREGHSRSQFGPSSGVERPGPTNGHWRDADWLFCRDGKWRPVEPGTSPLAHGAAARVGRLRGYGNAIVAQAAQAFIESVM
jgi:DNA (cytosine-5)-methyltransferase 1